MYAELLPFSVVVVVMSVPSCVVYNWSQSAPMRRRNPHVDCTLPRSAGAVTLHAVHAANGFAATVIASAGNRGAPG